ncbi:TPA: sugar kinase [Streptococcus equi subsp. zooepidemicus]|uniref:sugar kinase n=1 Tax=Streptococcus equi TaxID=1336 RepID=UPI001E428D1B|nr:sugar kinase [Streptococcus equi]MCD3404612.1 sugar kinase [Streptococcus equi subsp. zooepidemicus]HEL0622016.1 sugar kinase [Streptococcus equi subsp. zooepidemicus]HEL0715160.1 sugar kinase [Streptococcus equi subsp. zooepidemicus]HEL1307927.1 sugar kinase [Streptococcus equi subsp. zooepidemicus]
MTKVLLVGEPLIRISPSHFQTLGNACQAQLYFGGSEVNIARTLSGFGAASSLLTALPDNQVGRSFEAFLRQSGVATEHVQWCGDRVGVYYLENGFGCRPSQVAYDRSASSFSLLGPQGLDYGKLFEAVTHFHFSGITLALGKVSQDLVEQLAIEAMKRQVCVSFDLNFRSSMISVREAKRLFSHFAQYADLIFGMEPLKCDQADQAMFDRDKADQGAVKERLAALYETYHLKAIFHTERHIDDQGVNHYLAYAYDGQLHRSIELSTPVLQRVGSGDAFVAGCLYQLMRGQAIATALDFAAVTASLKCTVADDQLFVSANQVDRVMRGNREVRR